MKKISTIALAAIILATLATASCGNNPKKKKVMNSTDNTALMLKQ